MFITFEGIDFCGKSTQVRLLEEYLSKKNKRIEIIREPGGTKISESIRELLLDNKNSEMMIETELLLFTASRAQLVNERIVPWLKEGYFVISDRFHDSSIAYQGYGRGISVDTVKTIQNFAINKAIPDITFFIDISLEEAAKRKKSGRGISLDRIEVSNDDFYERVRNGYLKLCETEKRFRRIDGSQSVEEIHEIIIEEIEALENQSAKE